jgi:AraC family transcriptional regulator of adaptative response / DNA-3-methyladenine glycosylase II
MMLDPTLCYEALRSKDRRFDGRFFVGVQTTGIYCRPGCPAKTPKKEHVAFFAHPAAAEEAGFRACLRCRPDTSPHSPAGQGTSATVTRALRILATEPDAGADLERLADRLGVGPRHLRRLFVEHVGASPRSVVHTRRAHFARRLLETTDWDVAAVAHAAGYGGERRMRAAVSRAFGRSPAALRGTRAVSAAAAGRADARTTGGAIEIDLPFTAPYDAAGALAYRAQRAIPGVERADAERYVRTIRTASGMGALELIAPAPDARAMRLRLWVSDANDLFALVARARRMLDLEADTAAIDAHLAKDKSLAPLVRRRPGLRLPGAWDAFELAVRAVLGQQVSVAAATTVAGRLVAAFGESCAAGEALGVPRLFPTPARLASSDVDALRALGLNRARAATIVALARAVEDGAVRLETPRSLEEFEAAMCQVAGIGPWTAHYVALRGLLEPDAFPAADLGLRQALAKDGAMPSTKELLERAERWRPWRGYAALHLWMRV